MHFFALLFPLLLATASGSPAPEAERKVNNGPYEYATRFSPFSRPPVPIRKTKTKDWLVELPFMHRRIIRTFMAPSRLDQRGGFPSANAPTSNVLKHKTASASTASKTKIKFCQIFADKHCSMFSNDDFLDDFTTSKSKLIVGRCSALDEFGILGCDTNDVFAFKCILK
jgi:hypothetical protein